MDYNWLENVPSSLTPIPVYQPDFGFLQSMQMKANQQYDQGLKEVKTAYSSLFNQQVTGEEATKRQQDYAKEAQNEMKAISATDLSDPKNVLAAENILAPFHEDKLYLQNIALTSHYQNEFSKQESMKNSKNKEERALYNSTIDYYLNKGVEDLAKAPMTNEGYNKLEKRKSIGVVNIADVALQHIKDVGFIKTTDANGNVMNITTNGPKSVEAYNAVYRSIVTRPEYAEQNRVLSIARGEMEMDKIKKDNPNVSEQQLKDAFAEKAITGNVEWYAKSIADYRKTALAYRRQNAPYLELDANGIPVDKSQNPRTAEDQAVVIDNFAKAQLYENLAKKSEEEFTKGFGYVQTDKIRYSTNSEDYIKGVDVLSSIYQKQVNDIRNNTNDYIQNLYLSYDADAFSKSLANISSVEQKVNPIQQEVNKQAAEVFKEQLSLYKAETGVEQKEEQIGLKALELKTKLNLPITQEDYDKAYGSGFTMKSIGTSRENGSGIDIGSGDIDMPGTNVKQVATLDTYNSAKLKIAIDINRDSFGPEGMLNMLSEDVVPNGLTGPEILTLSGSYNDCLTTGKYDEKSLAVREKVAKLLNDLAPTKDKVYAANTGPNTVREGLGVLATTDAADPLFLTQNPKKQDIVMKMAMQNQTIQKNSAELLKLNDDYKNAITEFLRKNNTKGDFNKILNKDGLPYTTNEMSVNFPTVSAVGPDGTTTEFSKTDLANMWQNGKTVKDIPGIQKVNGKPVQQITDANGNIHTVYYNGVSGYANGYGGNFDDLNGFLSSKYGKPEEAKKLLNRIGEEVIGKMPQFATGESSPELTFDLSGTGKEIDPAQKTTGTKLIKEALLPINQKRMYVTDGSNKMVEDGISEEMKKSIMDGRFKDFITDIAGAVSVVPIGPNGGPAVRINTQLGKGEKDNETIGKSSVAEIKKLGAIYIDIADDAKGEALNQIPQAQKFQRYGKLLTNKDETLTQDDFETKNGFVYTIQADPYSKDVKGKYTKVYVYTSQWQVDKQTGAYIIDPKTAKPAPTPMTTTQFNVGEGGYSIDHIVETMKNNWILNEMQKRRMLLEYNKKQPSAAGTMSAGDIMKQFGY